MEEQMERHNPVNPKQLMNNRRENGMRLEGSGFFDDVGKSLARSGSMSSIFGGSATPSMGLSEFRGGSQGSFMKGLMAQKKAHGAGAKGMLGRTQKAPVKYAPTEAHQMGLHLGKHLNSLHGGAYHKDFVTGMMEGGAWYDFLDPNKNGVGATFNKVKNEFVNPSSVLRHDIAPKIANEFTNPNSILRDKVVPIGAQVAQYASPFIDAALPGVGTAINTGFKAANYANKAAKMAGYGGSKTGAYEGQGRKKRAPAAAGSGRHRRAEIVKKVMSEKGMKMIEASKYVKEHGLY
jgi:hypothetical protein